MNRISGLTWAGLTVNLIVYGIAWMNLSAGNDGEYYSYSFDIWQFAVIAFSVSLLLQFASLVLLSAYPKTGRVSAVIGAIIMAPIGLIFLMGYMTSYEKETNVDFQPYTPDVKCLDSDNGNSSIIVNFKTSQLFIGGVLMIIMGGVILIMGLGTGGIIIGAGILALVNGFRMNGRVILGVIDDKFIVTPGIYAETYMVPLQNVSVLEYEKNNIKFCIKSANTEKTFTLKKNMMESEDIDTELNNILAKII